MESWITDSVQGAFAGGLVLGLPGYALLAWLGHSENDPLQRLVTVIGLSVAFTGLLALAAFTLHWQVSPLVIVLLYIVFGGIALLGHYRRHAPLKNTPTTWLGLALFALLMGWRLYQVHNLALPVWVDSVHHTLIVRKVLEEGGVPESLYPYLPVPFYYHFAFHILTALFSFWAGLTPAQGILIMGQILNAVVALSVYRLGMALWRDWRRAGVAALLVGFVTLMPGYYVSWGRYTLLTGLVLLSLAMATALETARMPFRVDRVSVMALLTAGVFLAHYLAGILLVLFLTMLSGQTLLERDRPTYEKCRWKPLLLGVVGAVILTVPWLIRVWSYAGQLVGLSLVLPPQSPDAVYFSGYGPYLWQLLGPTPGHLLLLPALFGLIRTFRHQEGRPLGWWTVALGLLCIPWGIRLHPFRPDNVIIVLFLPIALLSGEALVTAMERLGRRWSMRIAKTVGMVLLVVLCIWGVGETRSIVNPDTVLATNADVEAIRWLERNTPAGARFLINVTRWQYNIYRGTDGGWWILPLTGRQTILPPVLYVLGDKSYVSEVNVLTEQASSLKGCTPDFWDLVRKARITHIYLGSQKGSLRPEGLAECPGVDLLYAANGVHIYRVQRPTLTHDRR